MRAGRGQALVATRAHRVLIGVVVAGAVVIAGIGFAGSYAAVRELAVKKGFGNFSYVFPIGIDAGICVLLALDLLLTWIRIPFPLLRQTAWLLTAATIAFNGAAAWPDPLGVGMHAVMPVLFVVAVEAARHAIGRIADITADKHMEGVRLTRWLLSPVPTFLLWRRMKLWELRSYDQVIKLEQERLVYQASLRSRFGRAWHRKAPVESLMPLRLARYGVPLAETAPAGLAAAGIDEPPIQFTVERTPIPAQRPSPELEAAIDKEREPAPVHGAQPQPVKQPRTAHPKQPHDHAGEGNAQHLAGAYQDWMAAFGIEPTNAQFALWLRDRYGIATAAGGPLSDEQLQPLLQLLKQRDTTSAENGTEPQAPHDADDGWGDYFSNAWLAYAQEHGAYPDAATLAVYVYERDQITGANGRPITGEDLEYFVATFRQREFGETKPPINEEATEPAAPAASDDCLPNEGQHEEAPVGAGAHPAKEMRSPKVSAAIDDPAGEDDATGEPAALTTVDRYYLAWREYQSELGEEPRAEQLSAYLASKKGMNGRGGKPVSPSTLRRYLLPFRVYKVWAQQRVSNETPSLDAIVQECAAHGITAQHNKPLTTDYIADQAVDFERRWQALIRHHAQSQQ
ncbi:DUF2637 domain-containing protein [Streptomyces sp. CoT10]|uniref:DUF2637 domain-containing protein n=2 Tax=unclassified Streptomyces TaxID=2593676 RepID=UPI001CD485A0|nr:DUF2637 domain-containing protein [Streptomyces sp. CoT10]